MDFYNQVLSEIFKCDKCLDVMIDPVSTKCGHKFCIECICINNTDFGCSVCKIYLRQEEFYSNFEMKKSIKNLNESSKSNYQNNLNYLNLKEYGSNMKSFFKSDDNFEMTHNKQNCGFNKKNDTNSNSNKENTNFSTQTKYRIKRKHNELDRCFRFECNFENIENKLDQFMNTFSKPEKNFENSKNELVQYNSVEQFTFCKFQPVDKKFKR